MSAEPTPEVWTIWECRSLFLIYCCTHPFNPGVLGRPGEMEYFADMFGIRGLIGNLSFTIKFSSTMILYAYYFINCTKPTVLLSSNEIFLLIMTLELELSDVRESTKGVYH